MNIILLDKTIKFIKYFCINIIQNVMKKKKKKNRIQMLFFLYT